MHFAAAVLVLFASMFMIQGFCDNCVHYEVPEIYTFFSAVICRIPWIAVSLILCGIAVAEIILLIKIGKAKKYIISPDGERAYDQNKQHDNWKRNTQWSKLLEQPKHERNREKLLSLWRYNLAVMRNDIEPQQQSNEWKLLLDAAEAVDVEIVLNGELPEERTVRKAIVSAVHECLTNTVKHAGGNRLEVNITGEDLVSVSITNDARYLQVKYRKPEG